MAVKRKWKPLPFPWVLCFWAPGEWSLQTQLTWALGTAPVSLLSCPHGLLPQAHLKCSVIVFILSLFRALVQICALTKNSKNANFCCKKGKTWKFVENVIYFSDLWTFKPNASIFIIFTVETSLRTKFTQNTLMLKSTPKILQKLNFSGIKPYSLCSGQDWEQNQSI